MLSPSLPPWAILLDYTVNTNHIIISFHTFTPCTIQYSTCTVLYCTQPTLPVTRCVFPIHIISSCAPRCTIPYSHSAYCKHIFLPANIYIFPISYLVPIYIYIPTSILSILPAFRHVSPILIYSSPFSLFPLPHSLTQCLPPPSCWYSPSPTLPSLLASAPLVGGQGAPGGSAARSSPPLPPLPYRALRRRHRPSWSPAGSADATGCRRPHHYHYHNNGAFPTRAIVSGGSR